MKKAKKNWTLRMMIFALAFTLISIALLGGTLAKYTGSLTASDTARVAKWGFDGTNVTDIFSDTYVNVKSEDGTKVVAPGTDGDFSFVIAAGTSEVTTEFTFSFTETNANNIPIIYKFDDKYYSSVLSTGANYLKIHGETSFDTIVIENGGLNALATAIGAKYGNIAAGTNYNTLGEQKIEWFWAFEQDASDNTGADIEVRDTDDTTLGENGNGTVTINAVLTAVQVD